MPPFLPCPRLPVFEEEPRLYLLPLGALANEAATAAVAAGSAWPIAGGSLAFAVAGVAWREGDDSHLAVTGFAEFLDWAEALAPSLLPVIHRVGATRALWAGLDLHQPRIMGIVNATPDSFSDGGEADTLGAAIARGIALAEAGADIIDVGGESTRPGAQPVSEAEEIARTRPVVQALAERGLKVSIDTRHAAVMAAALEAGASIINDIAALREPGALKVAAASKAALCLMHMQGEPRTMQAAPAYRSVPLDIFDFLEERVAACEAAGIARERIAIDPGIGFGKTAQHNLDILAHLGLLHGLGCPVLVGASRKSFIAALSQDEPPKARLPGTLAAHQAGLEAGIQILRVHDVAEARQALALWQGLRG